MGTRFQHLGDFARRDALNIHLGNRQFQRPFTPHASFQSRGIEVYSAPHLGHFQFQLAEPGRQGLWLVAVGVSGPFFCALIGLGSQHGRPFELHRFVEQQPQDRGEPAVAGLGID
jgi:hypothetical protein